MTQYLLSVHMVEGAATPSDEEIQRTYKAVDVYNQQLMDEGAWVFAGGLQPPDTATVVDGRGAEAIVTDGPFAEAKEQLGGFWVITAADLDAALAQAKQASAACGGPVEVRAFQEEPEA